MQLENCQWPTCTWSTKFGPPPRSSHPRMRIQSACVGRGDASSIGGCSRRTARGRPRSTQLLPPDTPLSPEPARGSSKLHHRYMTMTTCSCMPCYACAEYELVNLGRKFVYLATRKRKLRSCAAWLEGYRDAPS